MIEPSSLKLRRAKDAGRGAGERGLRGVPGDGGGRVGDRADRCGAAGGVPGVPNNRHWFGRKGPTGSVPANKHRLVKRMI